MKLSSPKVLPLVSRNAEVPPTVAYTDEQRIAAARKAAMELCRIGNAPDAQYGWGYRASYYEDSPAGPRSSNWDADTLHFFAEVLECPILKRSKRDWAFNAYNPATGEFELPDCTNVSFKELQDAFDARVAELGLSKVKIWEWFNQTRGNEYQRADLATTIEKFKER